MLEVHVLLENTHFWYDMFCISLLIYKRVLINYQPYESEIIQSF